MNNYENQREIIDAILNSNNNIAIDIDTNKITTCKGLACSICLFFGEYNENTSCYSNTIKWLVAEYVEPVEPEIDWSKVPIDTAVLISVDNKNWFNRYFAGVNEKGQPTVFCYGATQWSNGYEEPCHFKYIKLAEVE
mgnify:CR=1 FL=1